MAIPQRRPRMKRVGSARFLIALRLIHHVWMAARMGVSESRPIPKKKSAITDRWTSGRNNKP